MQVGEKCHNENCTSGRPGAWLRQVVEKNGTVGMYLFCLDCADAIDIINYKSRCDTVKIPQRVKECAMESDLDTVTLGEAVKSDPSWWLSSIPSPPFDVLRLREYWNVLVKAAFRLHDIERELAAMTTERDAAVKQRDELYSICKRALAVLQPPKE